TFAVLLWKLDAAQVGRLLLKVGWGFIFILAQEAVPHLFNALGWRFAIPKRHEALFRFGDLYRHRIQGDGVNYLTPSATIAGEYTRALLIDNAVPADVRLGSVVSAKCTQSLAQILFALLGLAVLVPGSMSALARYDHWIRWGSLFALVALAAGAAGFWLWAGRSRGVPSSAHLLKAVPGQLRDFYLDHPIRWWISTGFFALGYAWTAVEVYAICAFLGVRVTWITALLIEVLSNVTDMAFFMVPAKVGTQEAGKTAILHLLGLGAQTGLALGIVRHIRELAWAGLGLLLYTQELRKNPEASLSPPR
ncbi:MAG: flippase-like domain-containing protein, partial [Elusimicrobia bacterium]|nr:flippase-like domain-containing protein [Elusimicrobiota bacterium]